MRRLQSMVFCWLFVVGSALAADDRHLLFAVDVSMNTQQRSAVIKLLSRIVSEPNHERAIGLTLFDDTVRDFVKAGTLRDRQQLQQLTTVLTDMPLSSRSTSNLAVGIERAIDDAVPSNGAELFVFARGVIDTETSDPRARFEEWLERVLLPQAREKNIRITLVAPNDQGENHRLPVLAFSGSAYHRLVPWQVQEGIPSSVMASLDSFKSHQDEIVVSNVLNHSASTARLTTESPNQASVAIPSQSAPAGFAWLYQPGSTWLRLILLLLSTLALAVILVCRRQSRRRRVEQATTLQQSASYMPLSTKPGASMSHWTREDSRDRLAQ